MLKCVNLLLPHKTFKIFSQYHILTAVCRVTRIEFIYLLSSDVITIIFHFRTRNAFYTNVLSLYDVINMYL